VEESRILSARKRKHGGLIRGRQNRKDAQCQRIKWSGLVGEHNMKKKPFLEQLLQEEARKLYSRRSKMR
jgi:hypothetical protein